jgi:uncharacterized repeat protein (TIGR01451 family)
VKLRRVLGTLTALAFFGTMLQPLPALASPPTLAVITLDPTATSSASQTGTAPFDATSYNPIGGANPGTDASGTDHIVRTNDLISYDFQYSVNSAPGLNITLTSTLGLNAGLPVADWTVLPAQCITGSSISPDKQTLTCVVGPVAQGSAQDVVANAKVRVTAPNGATIQPSITVDDPGNVGTVPVTNSGYWLDQSHQSATLLDTITSVAKFNAMKTSTVAKPVIEPYTYFGEGGIQGYYVDYPVLVREGDGSAKGKVGITTAASPITITDTLTPGLNAILPAANACGVNGSGITIVNEPYGRIGVVGGATSTKSVVDSGTITCTQAGGAGTAVTITITGADTTGSSYPVNNAAGAGVDNLTYVVAGYMRLFVPDTGGNLGVAGTNTPFGDTYTGINPGEPDESPGNLTATNTLTAQGPASAHGAAGKVFKTNTAEANFASSNGVGPALTAGQEIVSIFALSNNATVAQGSADLTSVVGCDTIDTASVHVTPFDGTTGAVDTLWGGAVHISNLAGGSFSDGTPPAGFTVSYGDATSAANCAGATGFVTSATDPVFTAGNPIVRVKVTANTLTASPAQQLRIDLSETVVNGLAAGTIVRNDIALTANSSTGGPGLATSAFTRGQIFTTSIATAKYMFKDTSGNAVFNANGVQPPSAAGKSSGSNGLVDTNQQVVAALDDDGSQGTLPASGVVTCDIIPANLAVKDFDGTTGPTIATYGGPVAFLVVSGSTPAAPVVEYSMVAGVGGDTCLDNANFSTTIPAVRSTIKRVRATITLPALTRYRMFVNMQVATAVAPHTVITNNTTTTVGGTGAQAKTETVTVEPETVQVQKSTTTPNVTAGNTGSFTIQGFVQGPGTPSSGVISVTDTLPAGLTYVPNSTVLTNPPAPTTWQSGSANATPVIATVGSNQVLTWVLGTATAAPGVFIQLPTLTFTVNTDISLSGGSVLNSVTIADTADGNPAGVNHTATASILISNPGAYHISKTTPTPQIPVGGTITWLLNYANTGATPSATTEFIDELPYSGDVRGSSFHGTIALATATGTNGETFRYTKATHGQINDDPGCTSNGGVVSPPTGGCLAVAATTWCPNLSGGACPANLGEVTAVRILEASALPANSGTRTLTITATTNGNVFTDIYWNTFGSRTSILTLGVHSPPVQTIVPTPASPFVTLVKSCLAPVTCIAASQAPGTDITYQVAATNTGGHTAGLVVITDPVPTRLDFKLGTASGTFSGNTVTVSYSTDGISFTYTPVSAGGGAATGYDRNVHYVRWTLGSALGTTGPTNTGTVQFTAAIQ